MCGSLSLDRSAFRPNLLLLWQPIFLYGSILRGYDDAGLFIHEWKRHFMRGKRREFLREAFSLLVILKATGTLDELTLSPLLAHGNCPCSLGRVTHAAR